MDITVLKSQIMKNELQNLYIFTGNELGIQKIYLEQMSKVLGMPIVRADSVLSIYSRCTTRSLFGNSVNFYVIRNDFDIQKQEEFYKNLSSSIGKNVIVLLYDKIDSRLKFGKYFKDSIVPFEKLSPNVLCGYIMRESDLERPDAELLSNKVTGSYDLAMLEIDKIHQYGDRLDKVDSEAFHELLDCGVIYQPTETNVFDFVDAVCNRNNRSFKLAQTLIDNKVSAINALGTLYNSMKTIMLIKCFSGGKITEVTGLDNRQIFFNKKYAGKFSVPEIVEDVQFLIDLIDDIKSGKIEDRHAYFYALVHIM